MIPKATTLLLERLDHTDQSVNEDDSPSLMEISFTSSHEDMVSTKGSCGDHSREPEYELEDDPTSTTPPVRDVCINNLEKPLQVEQMEQEDHPYAVSSAQAPRRSDLCMNSSEEPEEVRLLMEIKAKYEAEMAKYIEQITTFQEAAAQLRAENDLLRDQLREFKLNNPVTLVKDLQDEVKKWEQLYFETAEIGAARISRLEIELEQLRVSSKSANESNEQAQEHTNNLRKALRATVKSSKAAQKELEAFKQRANEHESLLKEMLDKVQSEKEREIELLKSKQENEQEALLEKIEDLVSDLKAKSAIIERERNQASKREARLKEQIRKLQPSSPTEFAASSKTSRGAFDSALTTFNKVLDGSLCLCSTEV